MIQKYLRTFIASLTVLTLACAVVTPTTAMALDPGAQVKSGVKAAGDNGKGDFKASIKIITNVLLFILGAVAVIMIIIGGIRYTVAGGDSTAVTNAKNTILYAVIGLIVALLAYAIVNFIINQFAK